MQWIITAVSFVVIKKKKKVAAAERKPRSDCIVELLLLLSTIPHDHHDATHKLLLIDGKAFNELRVIRCIFISNSCSRAAAVIRRRRRRRPRANVLHVLMYDGGSGRKGISLCPIEIITIKNIDGNDRKTTDRVLISSTEYCSEQLHCVLVID
jgi:hypothetical protein